MGNFIARWFWLTVMSVAQLAAADPVWISKPAAQWTEQDAWQVLAKSPWAKETRAVITRRQTEDHLREAGQMGQPHGVGYDGVDPKPSGPKPSTSISSILSDPRGNSSPPGAIILRLAWESALPVRIAELKSHETEPPTLAGDGYRIAVYGIPGGDFKEDPKRLGEPLKNLAVLKREGKKEVKLVRVEVFPEGNSAVVVYLFPLSAEITKNDGQVQFEARIGRIIVAQIFELSEMEFMGKLEL